ncbi:MAG: crossover junction endodeoxyribonuclease RuvC [Bacteriovoracaceae bacterium]|jgi:crossover junction endodeoxyribonuclease RuvC|nr:crossover junction endodeoxyribonuclease RuvC [Bacteriovoracaceae bacterium]
MIILGIDPGSLNSGYAVIDVNGRNMKYIASGVLVFAKKVELINRLGMIYESAEDLIRQYNPEEIALESLIYVKSIPALAKLSQARGAMVAAFTKTHINRIFEYGPTSVKASVTGHGQASKESIQKILELSFQGQINKKFKTHDESDALAIAMTHGLLRKRRKSLELR